MGEDESIVFGFIYDKVEIQRVVDSIISSTNRSVQSFKVHNDKIGLSARIV